MKMRWYVVFLIVFFLVSCAPTPKDQETDVVAVQVEGLTDAMLMECGNDFPAPEIISPDQVLLEDSPPYDFKWKLDCDPVYAYLELDLLREIPVSFWDVNVSDHKGEYTYVWDLIPARTYTWIIRAKSNNNEIKISNNGTFTVGPICSLEELVAPILVSPADGTVTSGKGWGNPYEVQTIIKMPLFEMECTPEYFEVDLSLNEDFSGDDNWNIGSPGHIGTLEIGTSWTLYEDDTNELQDCSLYYWRARAAAGNDYSDWSETFTFFLDVYGNCFHFPELKALVNANCREDPWAGDNYVSIVWEGDTAELLGLNEDATWGMFKLKNELECWVNMAMMETDPPDAVFFPGYYPVIEHGDKPDDVPAPVPQEEESEATDPCDGVDCQRCCIADTCPSGCCCCSCRQ